MGLVDTIVTRAPVVRKKYLFFYRQGFMSRFVAISHLYCHDAATAGGAGSSTCDNLAPFAHV